MPHSEELVGFSRRRPGEDAEVRESCKIMHFNMSKAPFVTLGIHASLLVSLTYLDASLHSELYADVACFWLCVMLAFMSFLYVCCKDPGYVRSAYKETDSIIKSKALTHADFSHEMSINPPLSPKFGTSRTQHPLSNRKSEESSRASPKFSTYIKSSKESLSYEANKENTGQMSEEIVESEAIEEEDEGDRTDEVSAVPENDMADNKQGPHLIVERRYCTACKLEQPIRAKHCKECKNCVALHDHHCPWLGICIGERNRRAFYWYLLAQTIELWWADVRACRLFELEDGFVVWLEVNLMRLSLVVVMVFFTIMLTCLLLFHSYLACSNRTTWEHVSWEKISYLKEWPINYGSPFSRGCIPNLYMYCLAKVPRPYRLWEVPMEFPEVPPKDCLLC